MRGDRRDPSSEDVTRVLGLVEEVGGYGLRRRLGALLQVPLTVQQLRALTALVVEGQSSPARLGALLEIAPATTTGIADRLERAGMITRRADDRDGRGRTLTATPAGHAVVRQLLAADVADDAEVLAGLTPAELAGFEAALQGLLRELGRMDGR